MLIIKVICLLYVVYFISVWIDLTGNDNDDGDDMDLLAGS